MTNLLGQLKRWRFVERVIRLAWGAGRWVAVVGAVLLVACLIDWLADRYLGSESWRKLRKDTWVFAPRPGEADAEPKFNEVVDETPRWLRYTMTGGQVLLALGLAYVLLVRPWRRTPPIDDFATEAEKAIPQFGHRIVTAVQLNRPGAKTQGMSQTLIAEVTREAGEMARAHNLLKLVNYTRVFLALAVALPVLLIWAGFAFARPELASVLLQRQMLLNVEIPRTIQLKNVSQDVWPTGSEVTVRYKVTGEYDKDMTGRLRIEPDGQPEEYYDLKYERDAEDGGAYFTAKLPAASSDFSFSARLGNGRTREQGRIKFEAPPTATKILSWKILPRFLGTRDGKPNGPQFERQDQDDGSLRGEVVDALPLSEIRVGAVFSKPVRSAILVPIERGEGIREKELAPVRPLATAEDRAAAEWKFPTTPRMIAYRIDLVDDRGFVNSVPIRRNVRMLEDRPPVVEFLPESDRHPDPTNYYGKGDPRDYQWGDKFPLAEGGRVLLIYRARSEQGIGRVNIRYRVYPKGVAPDAYPEEIQKIQHPREDPNYKIYAQYQLKPTGANPNVVGHFVSDLGLFEKSWEGLSEEARDKVNIDFYSIPSSAPGVIPNGLEAGGRFNFEIDGLKKIMPDGSTAKLEVGDTVELFMEVFDKNPTPDRPAGYTREARRKIVVTPVEAMYAIEMRDKEKDRRKENLEKLRRDQENVFKVPVEEPPPPPKK